MRTYTNRRSNWGKRLTVLVSILFLPLAIILSGCDQQLEESPPSQITPDNFYQTPEQFRAAANGVYAQLRGIEGGNTGDAAMHTADAIMVPTRGPNWGDGGLWRQLTRHTWDATHPDLNGTWVDMYAGIARANTVLGGLNQTDGLSDTQKAQFGAEVRFLRAYFYYWLMDFFGGAPIIVEQGNEMYDFPQPPVATDPPPHHNRLQIYDFLLQELTGCTSDAFDNSCVNDPAGNSVLANLQSKSSIQYGRATKGAGYAFLARLLVNSQVYGVAVGGGGENRANSDVSPVGTGPSFYEEALTAANIVINGANGVGSYSLADNYFKNFAADNQTSPEVIFAVAYKSGSSDLGTQSQFKQSMHYNLPNPGGTPWNGFTTIANFYKSYATEPGPDGEIGTQDDVHNDTRGKSFLVGQQYTEPSVGCAGDDCYSDASSEKVYMDDDETIPLFHTLDIPKIRLGDVTESEASNFGWPSTKETFRLDAPGARPLKFEIDPSANNDFWGNDFPLFRLAEMYLIRAEAQWKTNTGDPINTLNTLREKREASGADISLSGGSVLQKIMRERGHELLQELTRRQDLIRYEFAHDGAEMDQPYAPTWTGPWLFKEGSDDHRVLFPIPQGQLSTNPNLEQNPGYN